MKMARIRSIKPEIRTSEKVCTWPIEVRYFWVLLWGYVNDHGKGVDNARLIKADAYPLDDDITAATVEGYLSTLADDGVIVRYEAAGKRLLAVKNWEEHQRPSHRAKDIYPDPPETLPQSSGDPPESLPGGAHGHIADGPYPNQSDSDSTSAHEQETPTSDRTPEILRRPSGESPETLRPEQGAGSREQGSGEQRSGGAGGDTSASPLSDAASGTDAAEFSDDVHRLCDELAARVRANGHKVNRIGVQWFKAMDRLIRLDDYTPEQIMQVMDWATRNEFWATNIRSAPKFREKFDTLKGQMFRGQRANTVTSLDQRRNESLARLADYTAWTPDQADVWTTEGVRQLER